MPLERPFEVTHEWSGGVASHFVRWEDLSEVILTIPSRAMFRIIALGFDPAIPFSGGFGLRDGPRASENYGLIQLSSYRPRWGTVAVPILTTPEIFRDEITLWVNGAAGGTTPLIRIRGFMIEDTLRDEPELSHRRSGFDRFLTGVAGAFRLGR